MQETARDKFAPFARTKSRDSQPEEHVARAKQPRSRDTLTQRAKLLYGCIAGTAKASAMKSGIGKTA